MKQVYLKLSEDDLKALKLYALNNDIKSHNQVIYDLVRDFLNKINTKK
jgi:hypothetical protein